MSTTTPEALLSDAFEVASDANYNVQGDDRDGTPTKVQASTGILRQGSRPDRQFPAQHRNWVDRSFAEALIALHTALTEHVLVPVYLDFTSDGTFTTPAVVGPVGFVEAWGAGGNGGEGASGSANSSQRNTGGGGGGGALLLQRLVSMTGATTYSVAIGQPDGAYANPKGGDTTLSAGVTTLARAPGGQHGAEGVDTASDNPASVRGGSPVTQTSTTSPLVHPSGEGAGGAGTTGSGTALPQGGYASRTGYAGGQPGLKGTDGASNRRGGGPGGGGGAGPGGPGGNGGSGGLGNNAGVGVDGGDGTSPSPNSGAGGGGGGGGGHGSTGESSPGAGFPGGSGRLRIVYFVPVYADP